MSDARDVAVVLKKLLEGVISMVVRSYGRMQLRPLYDSGIRYVPSTGEELCLPDVMFKKGEADAMELVIWRAAELRLYGEEATVRVEWRQVTRNGIPTRVFRCLVRRADGNIEDPVAELEKRQGSVEAPAFELEKPEAGL